MSGIKDTRTLVSDDNVVLANPITTDRELAKFRFHLQDIIKAVLNAQDPDVNNFSDADVAKLLDSMGKSVYDVGDRGVVDNASRQVTFALKGSPGTINAGEAMYLVGDYLVELVDDTFGTGVAVAVALESFTDTVPGRILLSGRETDVDTSGFVQGPLFIGDVPGELTQTIPLEGKKYQIAGYVMTVDPVVGVVYIAFSELKNTLSLFSIYDPIGNAIITALNVQKALDQVDTQLVGLHYNEYAESEAISIENAGVWTSKTLLSIPSLPVGDYTWEWSAEINVSAINRMINVKFEDDAVILGEADIEPGDATNWYTVGGFRKITQAVAAAKTLEILFKRSANPGTASIRRARIILKSL